MPRHNEVGREEICELGNDVGTTAAQITDTCVVANSSRCVGGRGRTIEQGALRSTNHVDSGTIGGVIMAEEARIKAYLSHRRENDDLSPFATLLIEWARNNNIELLADCKNAELSRPIDEFVGQLKTSSSTIFLLNDNYFKSRWCMGELDTFMENRCISFHGFIIACDNWLPEKNTDEFYENFAEELQQYWKDEANKSTSDQKREEAKRFAEHSHETVSNLKRLNIPREEAIRITFGVPVWTAIRRQRERARPEPKPCDGNELKSRCRQRLIDRFRSSLQLAEQLAVQMEFKSSSVLSKENVPDLVDRFLADSPQGRLNTFFRSALTAFRDMEACEKQKMRDRITEIWSLLLLGYLDEKVRERLLKPKYGILDTLSWDFREEEKEVAELLFATAEPSLRPQFVFREDKQRFEVKAERYFGRDKVQRADEFSLDSVLDSELALLWNSTFPGQEEKKANDYLREKDFEDLSDALKNDFKRGIARYYPPGAECEVAFPDCASAPSRSQQYRPADGVRVVLRPPPFQTRSLACLKGRLHNDFTPGWVGCFARQPQATLSLLDIHVSSIVGVS